jgi:mannose-6-phosphate isomerase-like protein (cupin superfamily)
VQEEVYFLVSGRAQGSFDGEVIDIEPWTAVRVGPETVRSFRAAGEEDAAFVTIAAPQAGLDDVEFVWDYWVD